MLPIHLWNLDLNASMVWEDRTKNNNNCSQSDKTEGKGMYVHVYVFSWKNQVGSNRDGKFNVLGVENSLGAKIALNRGLLAWSLTAHLARLS